MFGFLEDIGQSISSTAHKAAGTVGSWLGHGADAGAAATGASASAPPPPATSVARAGQSIGDVGRAASVGTGETHENAYRAPEPTKDAKPDPAKPGAGKDEEKKPDPKVVAATSATLAKAMSGWGTDEKAIMDSLRGKSKEEIAAIRAEYKKTTGNDLDGDLKGDLSGKDLKEAQAYMSGDPVKSAVAALQNSQGGFLGIGSDPDKIMATLQTLKPEDQAAVRAQYKKESGQSIDALLHSELKGEQLKQAQQELADKFSLGLGKGSEAADAIAKKSPTLVGKLSALQDAGWTVTYGVAGKGSFTDRGKKTIVIDPNEKSSPNELITTAAHESGHAAYTPDAYVGPEGLTKDQYVNKNVMSDLKDEGEATITNIEVKKELAAQGININVAGAGAAKYEELAKKYPDPKDRDKLREEIAKQFGSAEVPSVPKADGTMYKDYNEYYGEGYQKAYADYAKDHPKDVHAVDVRAGLDDKMAKMKDLKPDEKARIDARLAGLKGDDLIRETDAIERAMSGPNGERALATYSDLAQMAGDKKAKERLTPEVISMLVTGVGDRRTESDRGQAGVLGGMQAKDSATALMNMPAEDYKKMVDLLHNAGKDDKGKDVAGADAHAEQSLILKTIAARRDKWTLGTWDKIERVVGIDTTADKADKEITDFAKDIRGEKRADLIRETTLMDIDDVNTSKKDPDHLASGDNDTKTDNDGLYQRFADSCAVTTQQILRGEMDPVYARKLQKQGLDNPDPDSEISKTQETILEKYGGSSTLRLGTDARSNLGKQLNNAKLDPDKALLVNNLMNGNVTDLAKQKAALDEVRAKNDGHPTDAEVKAMQYNSSHSGSTGVWQGDAAKDLTNDVTHLTLQEHNITDGVGNHLDKIDGLLKSGQPVPFNVAWTGGGAHAMMMTDVRTGADGSRTYLVTDPWTGATRWVGQKDLSDGTWYQKTFGGSTSTVQDIVADKDQKV